MLVINSFHRNTECSTNKQAVHERSSQKKITYTLYHKELNTVQIIFFISSSPCIFLTNHKLHTNEMLMVEDTS
jgi:hypothetical protein